jgi:hypothetical protein
MKEIIIHISPIGDIDIEAEGFAGIGCKKATKGFEDEFGGVCTSTPKAEIHHIEQEEHHLRASSGGGMTSLD